MNTMPARHRFSLADHVITVLHTRELRVCDVYGLLKSKAINVDQVGAVVRSLERQGLVEFAGVRSDGRRYRLTDKGEKAYREGAEWRRKYKPKKNPDHTPMCIDCKEKPARESCDWLRCLPCHRKHKQAEWQEQCRKSNERASELVTPKETDDMPQPTQAVVPQVADELNELEEVRPLVPVFAVRNAKDGLNKVRAELRKQLATARENHAIALAVERDLAGVVDELERMLGDATSAT